MKVNKQPINGENEQILEHNTYVYESVCPIYLDVNKDKKQTYT